MKQFFHQNNLHEYTKYGIQNLLATSRLTTLVQFYKRESHVTSTVLIIENKEKKKNKRTIKGEKTQDHRLHQQNCCSLQMWTNTTNTATTTTTKRIRALENCSEETYDELLRRHQTDIRLLLRQSTNTVATKSDDLLLRQKLRECYQLLTIHRATTHDVSTQLYGPFPIPSSSSPASPSDISLQPVAQRLTEDLLDIIARRKVFASTRRLCLAVMREMTDGQPPTTWSTNSTNSTTSATATTSTTSTDSTDSTDSTITNGIDFSTTYGELRATSLVPVLMQMDVGSHVLAANLLNFVMWLDNANVTTRGASLACIARMAEEHRIVLNATGGVIEMVEAKLTEHLIQTTLRSGTRHSSTSVLATAFGLLSGGQPDIVAAEDQDGTPGREFFTVLNTVPHETHRYLGMQVSHVHWFSTIRTWLTR